MKQIPNLFTLLNLVFGSVAVIFILQTGETLVSQSEEGVWLAQLPEKIWWGSICIGIAAIIDFLDGFVARILKASSEMGKQLDSLADVVSFGVAPGLILYQLLRISFIGEESGLDTSIIYLMPALIFPCAGAWRLARYNISSSGDAHVSFRGVPIPAAGLVVASLPLILLYNYFDLASVLLNKWVLYLLILVLSYLMVSSLPMMTLKFSTQSVRENVPRIILVALSILAVLLLQWLAAPLIFLLYVIISLVSKTKST